MTASLAGYSPQHWFQLLLEAFSGQMRYIMPPANSGSAHRSPPRWSSETFKREVPVPPQLAPFNTKKQHFYAKLPVDAWTPLSLRLSPATLQRKLLSPLLWLFPTAHNTEEACQPRKPQNKSHLPQVSWCHRAFWPPQWPLPGIWTSLSQRLCWAEDLKDWILHQTTEFTLTTPLGLPGL